MRQAARKDGNQDIIIEALEAGGANIVRLHQLGHGVPDILVGLPSLTIVGGVSQKLIELLKSIDGLVVFHGANLLMEIKMPGGKLTDDEDEFFKNHRGQCVVVYSAEEALDLIGR